MNPQLEMRMHAPHTLNWLIAYHTWRAQGCRLSWETYRKSKVKSERQGANVYLNEARASEELVALAIKSSNRRAEGMA